MTYRIFSSLWLFIGITMSLHAQQLKVDSFYLDKTTLITKLQNEYKYKDGRNNDVFPALLNIYYEGDIEIDSIAAPEILKTEKRADGTMSVLLKERTQYIRFFCKKHLPLTVDFFAEMNEKDKQNHEDLEGLRRKYHYVLYLKDVKDDYIHVEDTARYISIENNELIIPSTDSRLTQIPRLAGNMAVDRFLQNHITYPTDGSLDKIEGEFLINFVVNKEGQIASFALVSERIKMPDTRMQRRMAKSKRDDFRNLFRKKFTEELNAAFSQMQWEKIGMRLNENNVEEPANVEFRKVHLTFEP